MKLHAVPSPQNESWPTSLRDVLQQAGWDGRVETGKAGAFEIEVPDADAQSSDVVRAWRGIAERLSGWARATVAVQLQLPPGYDAAPAAARMAAEDKSAPLAGIRDLNGSGARAALLKMLGTAAPEVVSVTAIPSEGAKGPTVVARIGGERYAELDRYAAARIAAGEVVRALAAMGAVPQTIALELRAPARADAAVLSRGEDTVHGLVDALSAINAPAFVRLEAAEQREFSFRLAIAGQSLAPKPPGRVVAAAGEKLFLLGEAPTELEGSWFFDAVHGQKTGAPPAVQPVSERRLNDVLLTLSKAGILSAARGLSAGGVLVTVLDLLLAPEKAFGVRLDLTSVGGARADALLFGESQARAVVGGPAERVGTILSEAHMRGVPAALIGEVTADGTFDLRTRSLATEWPMGELNALRRGARA